MAVQPCRLLFIQRSFLALDSPGSFIRIPQCVEVLGCMPITGASTPTAVEWDRPSAIRAMTPTRATGLLRLSLSLETERTCRILPVSYTHLTLPTIYSV